jgi:hypothetical protein
VEVVFVLVCAFTMFDFNCKVETAKIDEKNNNAKINATLVLTCVDSLPPRMND